MFAAIFLGASVLTAGMAVFQLFGLVNPLADPRVQMGIAFGVVLTVVLLIPRRHFGNGDYHRDTRFRLHRSSFRAALTGPFAEMTRPHSRQSKALGRYPARVLALFVPLVVLMFASQSFVPGLLMITAVMLTRSAAYEGDPIGIELDRFFGTRPKLRRNRMCAGPDTR